MVDLRKFKFNSNMKMDNVIFVTEETFQNTNPSYTYIDTSIPNPFNFIPLCFGNFSIDGGLTWQDIDFVAMTGYGQLVSNASIIKVQLAYETLVSSVKVRIYAFAPSTVGNISFAKPTPISKFYINTENTYDNLIANGQITLQPSSSFQTIYTHNLGYIPRVMLWDDLSVTNQVSRLFASGSDDRQVRITNTQLIYLADTVVTIYYRIYGGKNG